MRAAFRRFLLLGLMFVLPLEAWASAAMLSCAFAKGALAQAVALGDAPPCHSDPQPDGKPADHTCTHCAACAPASAAPMPVITSLPALPQVTALSLYTAAFGGFLPDCPERPPRPSLI